MNRKLLSEILVINLNYLCCYPPPQLKLGQRNALLPAQRLISISGILINPGVIASIHPLYYFGPCIYFVRNEITVVTGSHTIHSPIPGYHKCLVLSCIHNRGPSAY